MDNIQPDIRPDIWPDIRPDIQPDIRPDIRLDIRPDIWLDIRPAGYPDGYPARFHGKPVKLRKFHFAFAHGLGFLPFAYLGWVGPGPRLIRKIYKYR